MAGLRVAIVGAGSFGTALALALRRAGYSIEAIIARPGSASLKWARALARQVGARVVTDLSGVRAEVIWFCVPDSEIASAARVVSQGRKLLPETGRRTTGRPQWKGTVALHSSGALSSDALNVLRERGAAGASVHPLMTFVRGSRSSFAGVSFAIEGDAAAVRVARRVVKDLGGEAYSIRRQDKAAYHAWATFASPLFTALLATTEQVARLAGIERSEAARRMLPILRQTLSNYSAFGAAGAFSGPIVRGDVDTVKRHLRVLRAMPAARAVYRGLARAALQYLPVQQKAALRRILES